METAGAVLQKFYAAVVKRDLAAARACLADDMIFEGLFETYGSADEYMRTFASHCPGRDRDGYVGRTMTQSPS